MDEESDSAPQWKNRLVAWWEGYDLSNRKHKSADKGSKSAATASSAAKGGGGSMEMTRFGKPLWTATRVQVVEKIWGAGFSTPGGDDYIPYLLKPLGLNPAMSVLELSAGLGGATRLMASRFGCWVTGLEGSPVLAKEAMERSVKAGLVKQAPISHYDPENFHFPKRFDANIAKEFFCFVKNRESLTDAIETCLKPRGQLLFTDYVIDKDGPRSPMLQSWLDHEPLEPHVLTVSQLVNSLQQRNLDIRITEDITDNHRALVLTALQTLTDFLEKHSLDHETKSGMADEVELWARRVAALQGGLRVFRFFALKPHDANEG
jgi:cyclopropane fatty-acyl-phospholipid synthase-like methyltransferase